MLTRISVVNALIASLLCTAAIAQDDVVDQPLITHEQAALSWYTQAAQGQQAEIGCAACHQTTQQWGSNYDDVVALALTGMPSTGGAIQMGDCQMTQLTDLLFRSHLPLDDEPALLVINSATMDEANNRLHNGDVVLSINGKSVSELKKIRDLIEKERETELSLDVIRGGKKQTVAVAASSLATPLQPFRIGVQVEPPSNAIRSQLKLYENEGLLVTTVVEQSPAADAGVQVHDILLRANEQRLSDFEGLKRAINQSDGKQVQLTLMRAGKELVVEATPKREPVANANHGGACPAPLYRWIGHPHFLRTGNGIYFDADQDGSWDLLPAETDPQKGE